jgi:hypothetical protein
MDLVDHLRGRFEGLLINNAWHAIASAFFEAGGHAYVQEYVTKRFFELQRLKYKDGLDGCEVVDPSMSSTRRISQDSQAYPKRSIYRKVTIDLN